MKRDIGQRLTAWAEGQSHIVGLVQIGSRTRTSGSLGAFDIHSDWDFQIISSFPEFFFKADNYRDFLGCPVLLCSRIGRLGAVPKVTVVLTEGELDIVVLPASLLDVAKRIVSGGVEGLDPQLSHALVDLSSVISGGYKIWKGESQLGWFYQYVKDRIPVLRLSDDDVCDLANGFCCDYISTLKKIQRGELLAAQRWLHFNLAEVNFKLAHELRLRAGLSSFPDARRIEFLGDMSLVDDLKINAGLSQPSLYEAAFHCAMVCRRLVALLVGSNWSWPNEIKLQRI